MYVAYPNRGDIINVIAQSDIVVNFLSSNIHKLSSSPLFSASSTIEYLHLGTRASPVTVSDRDTYWDAFRLMVTEVMSQCFTENTGIECMHCSV